ncbi:hypothetical protein MUDAN_DOGOELCO_03267 [Lactiplantibacillus mudanjiangensis]|nr:hypothetical protein MUDAN_DOGOELCO_03267 [Lactiplantibacillus mudanjiangensis]
MAIYINGKSIHPFINGKRIGTIYRGGSKIYQDYIKVGTILGTWGKDNSLDGLDSSKTLNLSGKISKLKTGIIIHYDSWYDNEQVSGQSIYSLTSTSRTVSVTKGQLKIGSTIQIPVEGDNLAAQGYQEGTVTAIINSDSQIILYTSFYSVSGICTLWIYPRKIEAY